MRIGYGTVREFVSIKDKLPTVPNEQDYGTFISCCKAIVSNHIHHNMWQLKVKTTSHRPSSVIHCYLHDLIFVNSVLCLLGSSQS